MKLGYDRSLYLLACDHRSSFTKDLFGATEPILPETQARISDAKEIIYEGFCHALARGAPRHHCGILIDEQFGGAIAKKAKEAGALLAMPVEESGKAEFQFEYGEHFGKHVDAFNPDFAKVLVRYNPDGEHDLNRRQAERLARLSNWLHERSVKFLFELLVPATQSQLERSGSQESYDRELRPDLVVAAIRELQECGVDPDIWKVEGLHEAADCVQVVQQARNTPAREQVVCIVLGRGETLDHVREWLLTAARVPGFEGFAVGRTLWKSPLEHYVSGGLSRVEALNEIAERYLDLIQSYSSAARAKGSEAA